MVSDERPSAGDVGTFATTEEYYAAHRPGYSSRLFDYLDDRFSFSDSGRVLDLGCGTGEVGALVADRVGEVVAMDPDPDMLAQVEERARGRLGKKITVKQGSDADLPALREPFDAVAMGRSFHWMDQERTLSEIWRLLVPGGGIALIDNREWVRRGTRAWQDGIHRIITDYVDDVPDRTGPVSYDDPWDDKIHDYGFESVESLDIHVTRSWNADEIIGYLFSLSFCSPETLGKQKSEFENEVREYLADQNKNNFTQHDTETVISGIKPESV